MGFLADLIDNDPAMLNELTRRADALLNASLQDIRRDLAEHAVVCDQLVVVYLDRAARLEGPPLKVVAARTAYGDLARRFMRQATMLRVLLVNSMTHMPRGPAPRRLLNGGEIPDDGRLSADDLLAGDAVAADGLLSAEGN